MIETPPAERPPHGANGTGRRRFMDPRSPAMKRFKARYIFYLEVFGFAIVSLLALAVAACFFFQVDDVITDKDLAIQPRAESIKRAAGVLVTRVFVRNHQQVHQGDPLIEVVENPKWIGRYLVMQRMQTLLDEMTAPGQSAELAQKRVEQTLGNKPAGSTAEEADSKDEDQKTALPPIALLPDEEKLKATLGQRLAGWTSGELAKSPRVVVRSPINGVIVAPDDLAFKRVDADAEILKVVDLNDLRLTPKLSGDTVADARPGQLANIKAIVPDTKSGLIFRGDTVPKGRYFWQKERVTTFGVLDPKIKEIVKDSFKDRKITQRDDIPFNVKDVKEVEVDADLQTAPAGNKAAGSGAAAASPAAQQPQPAVEAPAPIVGDMPAELKLTGKVLEGKHKLNVQIGDTTPAVTRQVQQLVAKQLRGRVVEIPEEPKREGGPVRVEPLRIEAVRNVHVITKLKGENTGVKGPTDRLKREAARKAIRGYPYEKISDARQYEATVQIQNPPQFLKDRVLALMEEGKDVKARVEVRTGRRPVAFLLLKR